jgi:hypothetical protein
MVKGELPHQEAESEHNSKINHYADLIYRQMPQRSRSPRQSTTTSASKWSGCSGK